MAFHADRWLDGGLLGVDMLFMDGPQRTSAVREVALTLGQLRNVGEGRADLTTDYLQHTWSLSLEEQFYLCWRTDNRPEIILVGCLLAFGLRTARVRAWFQPRAVAPLSGALLAGLLIVGPGPFGFDLFRSVVVPVFGVLSAVLVGVVVIRESALAAAVLGWGPLVFVGRIS